MTSMLPGPVGRERDARVALAARVGRRALLAVQRAGQDAGAGGLAAAARAAEQVGVVDPAGAQRLLQRLGDVLLPMTSAKVSGRYRRYSARLTRPTSSTCRRGAAVSSTHADKGPPAHPPEPAYPCCLPALGEFGGIDAARGVGGQSSQPRGSDVPQPGQPRGSGRLVRRRIRLVA